MINVSKTVFLSINFSKKELEQAQNFTHKGAKVVKERLTVTGKEIGALNETIMTATRNGWAEWAKLKQQTQITNVLNCKTIIKLYRSFFQPKVFYGRPAWKNENLSKISELQNTVLHTATGGYSKSAVRNLELMTGVKPVDIQIQILTIKFLSKALSTNDFGLEIQLKSKQKHWRKRIDSLHPYIRVMDNLPKDNLPKPNLPNVKDKLPKIIRQFVPELLSSKIIHQIDQLTGWPTADETIEVKIDSRLDRYLPDNELNCPFFLASAVTSKQ